MPDDSPMLPPAVLAAARREFLRYGFAGASVDRMARAARVSKTTIYQHAPSKGALFELVVREGLRTVEGEAPPRFAGPPAEALNGLGLWLQRAFADPDNLRLYRINIGAVGEFPQLAADIHDYRRAALRPARAYFARLRDAGVLAFSDREDAFAAFTIMAVGGMEGLVGGEVPRDARLARAAVTALLFGHGIPGAPGRVPERVALPEPVRSEPEDDAGHRKGRLSPQRRARMLEAAGRAFLQQGFPRASMVRIAGDAGLAKTTLYRQYGRKDALFAATLRHLVQRQRARGGPLPLGRDVERALTDTADVLRARFLDPDNLALLRLLAVEATRFPAECLAAYRALRADVDGELRAYFAVLAAEGILAARDPDLALLHFFWLAVGGLLPLTGGAALEPHGAGVCRVFLRGFGGAARAAATRRA